MFSCNLEAFYILTSTPLFCLKLSVSNLNGFASQDHQIHQIGHHSIQCSGLCNMIIMRTPHWGKVYPVIELKDKKKWYLGEVRQREDGWGHDERTPSLSKNNRHLFFCLCALVTNGLLISPLPSQSFLSLNTSQEAFNELILYYAGENYSILSLALCIGPNHKFTIFPSIWPSEICFAASWQVYKI